MGHRQQISRRKPVAQRKAVTRPEYVEAEILQATGRGREQWIELAQALRPETAVHLARHLKDPSESQLLGQLLERAIFNRALPVIRANSKGLNPADQSEIVRDVYSRVVEAVLDGTPDTPDFLEAKFGLRIKQWTIDSVRSLFRRSGQLVPLEEKHQTEREESNWRAEQDDVRSAEFGERLTEVTARILERFPRRVQQAFVQHFYDGIAIESEREGAVTISSLHQVSGRAVRAWFAQVREAVKAEMRRNVNEHE